MVEGRGLEAAADWKLEVRPKIMSLWAHAEFSSPAGATADGHVSCISGAGCG